MQIKKNKIIIFTLLLVCSYFLIQLFLYEYYQNKNKQIYTKPCSYFEISKCSKAAFEVLISKLLIYKGEIGGKELKFLKLGYSPVWHPFHNFDISNALIHYTDKSNYKEENYNEYNNDEYYKFLANDYYNIDIYNFSIQDKTNFLTLMNTIKKENKKVILHLNLTQIDYKFMRIIFNNYKEIISGINLFLKLSDYQTLVKSIDLVNIINKNFILVARTSELESYNKFSINSKYYKGNIYNSTLVLSYINKDELDKFSIRLQQNTEKIFRGDKVIYFIPTIKVPESDLHWSVTITEFVKQLFTKQNSN